ncbi:uncharacterized protein EDB91DRAFT_1304043 [Suillus paluster]|uniref:uncharacterized protein n=1 Tax=Suillus paluster TaxID=48578 RepID=UPI001B886987|nr:uncharacterized protein EDB91DRAFT_1304043 [Suillus paluster]KAG1750518.1 hypothetical protein EDB91DRAFT_1304043 [Suillus paluster]
MTRPNTRPKNANQHPGEIVLKTKQKRRTGRQIQEDNDHIEHEQQEQEAAVQRNAERIAAIEDQRALNDLKIIMDPPRPRPQARPVLKVKKPVGIAEEEDVEIIDTVDKDGVQPVEGNPEEVQTHHNNAETDHIMSSDEELAEVQPRRKHVQKMAHREAVQVACLVDNVAGINQKKDQYTRDVEARVTSISDQKGKKGVAADVGMEKDDYAGISKTKDWAEKLATSKLLRPSVSHSIRTATHTHVSSLATSTAVSKITHGSLTSTNPGPPPTPARSIKESDLSLLDDNDSLEREAAYQASKKTQAGDSARRTTSDVVKFSSLSSPHTSRPVCAPSQQITRTESLSSPPPCTQPSRATARIPCCPELMSDLSMELYEPNDTEEAEDEAPSAPVNDDLPDGCQHNNTWCQVFIPTVANWAGGDVEPWGPDNHELRDVMQDIWDHIYKGRIEHEISSSGAVLKVAKQLLMEWRGGFGIAACSILTAFCAQDTNFLDPEAHKDFSRAMLKQNRFIFRDNAGLAPKAWTGIWRASFILQTFASHLNFTYGHVGIPNLDTKAIGARAAFTLAVTAVCCILQLVVDGNITFEIISETRGKCTKATKIGDGDIWTPVIKKGEQFAFSKPAWGPMTQKFMQPIIALPNEDFASIVQEAQQYAKHPRSTGSSRATSNVTPDEDDGFADLFAFC